MQWYYDSRGAWLNTMRVESWLYCSLYHASLCLTWINIHSYIHTTFKGKKYPMYIYVTQLHPILRNKILTISMPLDIHQIQVPHLQFLHGLKQHGTILAVCITVCSSENPNVSPTLQLPYGSLYIIHTRTDATWKYRPSIMFMHYITHFLSS